jgi:hypothetical protein
MPLGKAVDLLIDLVRNGYEFPDAVWRATQASGWSSERLEEAYDNQGFSILGRCDLCGESNCGCVR